ncbi:MAG: hypothetical protein JEZ11_17405 [Desulfobacterales bacterium]|nr:hypothetical protein [Desulfobacterales bacterium]
MIITTTLSDVDVAVLKNDLVDIELWVSSAVVGKIAACKKRMIAEWTPRLMADPSVVSIPANEDDLITLITSRADYQDRVERDATEGP